jgi:hypothetical protein
LFRTLWVWEWVGGTSGGKVHDGAWGVLELVQATVEESLEGVGLFVSDPSLVVLVEVVPGGFEVLGKELWDLSWGELVGSFENGTRGELGVILHQKLLTSLVAGWGFSFLGISGIDVIHDLIFVGTVVSGDSHVLPGGFVNVSTEWVGVVGDSNGLSSAEKSSNGYNF